MTDGGWKRAWRDHWHWAALGLLLGVAGWHAVNFADAPDADFPKVVRPHFNVHPPAAYRLAEPGDTLDRIGLYLAAGSLTLALVALGRIRSSRRSGGDDPWALWPAAAAIGLAATWYAATPGPTYDGWHGLGWRTMLDASAPTPTRLGLLAAALALAGVVLGNVVAAWPSRQSWWRAAAEARAVPLLAVAAVLVAVRQVELPGLEPAGYWPRCCLDLGLLAFGLALIRLHPAGGRSLPVPARVGVALG